MATTASAIHRAAGTLSPLPPGPVSYPQSAPRRLADSRSGTAITERTPSPATAGPYSGQRSARPVPPARTKPPRAMATVPGPSPSAASRSCAARAIGSEAIASRVAGRFPRTTAVALPNPIVAATADMNPDQVSRPRSPASQARIRAACSSCSPAATRCRPATCRCTVAMRTCSERVGAGPDAARASYRTASAVARTARRCSSAARCRKSAMTARRFARHGRAPSSAEITRQAYVRANPPARVTAPHHQSETRWHAGSRRFWREGSAAG